VWVRNIPSSALGAPLLRDGTVFVRNAPSSAFGALVLFGSALHVRGVVTTAFGPLGPLAGYALILSFIADPSSLLLVAREQAHMTAYELRLAFVAREMATALTAERIVLLVVREPSVPQASQ
jgi:hypothetical protein